MEDTFEAFRDFVIIMSEKYKRLDNANININYINKLLKIGSLKLTEDIKKELEELEKEKEEAQKEIDIILNIANKK